MAASSLRSGLVIVDRSRRSVALGEQLAQSILQDPLCRNGGSLPASGRESKYLIGFFCFGILKLGYWNGAASSRRKDLQRRLTTLVHRHLGANEVLKVGEAAMRQRCANTPAP
jgi:hypothetical protein